jgi:hypothetical protein
VASTAASSDMTRFAAVSRTSSDWRGISEASAATGQPLSGDFRWRSDR